ncbi:aspartyl protease AED3-like [Tasmannia lanceolata]|uniref:aspartyl protease AED3-like n=1 Tax=Tasmannia lanceolata TaxID=3420 RepID=UPI004062EF46
MEKLHPLLGFILLTLICLNTAQGSNPRFDPWNQGSTLSIMHVDDPSSPFKPTKSPSLWEKALFEVGAKDEARLGYLNSLVGKRSWVPIASARQIIQSATYVVRANVGTPPQPFLMAMDTSNDAAWIPCSGCVGCSSTVFYSSKSTTYKILPCQAPQCQQVPNPTCAVAGCSFNVTYGSSSFQATLSQDTLTLASDNITGYSFACLNKVTGNSVPPQGLLGLGRGPISFLSQTQNLYHSTFSYCLPSFKSSNFSGTLRLGPTGQPFRIKFTPLLKNPRRSSLYYVNLMGISVGRRLLNIPAAALAFDPATGAGTIFDSGTVITRLVAPAYVALRNEFRRVISKRVSGEISTLGGFDTCYTVPMAALAPTITFHFAGPINMSLPTDNVLIHSTAGTITCLAMASAPDNINSVLNVIANMQQQNHRILFDVPNSRLGISREPCT